MGTNYYYKTDICEHCGSVGSELHIGKSSCGWCFSLHVYPGKGPECLSDWEHIFKNPKAKIEDEYGRTVTADDMLSCITERGGNLKPSTGFDFQGNHSQPGPNNLVRHTIDGVNCIGHGEGTYDYLVGDFS